MKVWRILALVAVCGAAVAQDASPTKGNADRGRALLSLTGPSAIDLMRMTPLELQQYRCSEVRQEIQAQLDMRAAGSTGFYNMDALRSLEKKQCDPQAMDIARQRTEGMANAAKKREMEYANLPVGKCMESSGPKYPLQAIKDRHEGVAVVQLVVDGDRRVVSSTLRKTSGFSELDQSAVEWGRRQTCNFPPGKPYALPLTFNLSQR